MKSKMSDKVRQQMKAGLPPEKRQAWDLISHVHELPISKADKIAALATTLTFLVGVYINDEKDVAEVADHIREMIVAGGTEAARISKNVYAGGEALVNADLKKMGIQMPGVGEA